MYAFDAATGALKWTLPDIAFNSAAVANGVLYTTAYDSTAQARGLAAYDAATGARLFFTAGPGSTDSDTSPIVANGRVYVGGQDGNLYAYRRPGH